MTVAEVARLAGVSAPTVSRVLNGRAGVATSTRRRVEAVLRENGYQRPEAIPSAALIEVAFHDLESHMAIEIMRGVERVAREHELAVGFTELMRRGSADRPWTDEVLTRRPAGVIVVYSQHTAEEQAKLAASGIPLVALDPTGQPLHSTPSVGATNWSGGVAATQHLLDLGHRRIAVIAGPTGHFCARARLDGFRAAMDRAGVPVDESLVRVARFRVDDARKHAADLLALPDPPTAIFASDDLQAIGVYEAARRAGVEIPHRLSVVGFDDIEYANFCGPPLTTVRQPLAEMGATAAELALALGAGRRPAHTRIELATTLVVRESTAPPAELGAKRPRRARG
jgi:LacI family transcriptional regulator, xylobiose transport system transcriptional regulator